MENQFESLHKYPEIKLVEGKPVCQDCINGKHNHPNFTNKEMQAEMRGDCKNTGKINNREFQCHCGFGTFFIEGSWQDWKENIDEIDL